ncbi:hypothetical protein M408DRAFT_6069 [Serendipita vermifera MAFF 305830]|uniref:Uncharacterized protein n=1 Tax=Serendipita vermifera MAFF 305830 TaxID=933852 RepID=A0A0C2X6E8_SERVB|nr:hypothetical protein M408DRAFT_6069 [Serendipita vermifera MAFF 305830]
MRNVVLGLDQFWFTRAVRNQITSHFESIAHSYTPSGDGGRRDAGSSNHPWTLHTRPVGVIFRAFGAIQHGFHFNMGPSPQGLIEPTRNSTTKLTEEHPISQYYASNQPFPYNGVRKLQVEECRIWNQKQSGRHPRKAASHQRLFHTITQRPYTHTRNLFKILYIAAMKDLCPNQAHSWSQNLPRLSQDDGHWSENQRKPTFIENPSVTLTINPLLDPTGFPNAIQLYFSLKISTQTPVYCHKAVSARMESRKRIFDELAAQDPLPPSHEALLLAPPESVSVKDAVTFHLQTCYTEQLQRSEGVRKHLLNQALSPLTRIQEAAVFASHFHESKPPSLDFEIWSQFAPVSEQILEASTSPTTFLRRLPEYVRKGLVSIASKDDIDHEGQSQQYYTRLLDISPDQYARLLEEFAKTFPDNLAFVVLQLQYLGFGDRASLLLASTLKDLGFEGVEIQLDPSIEGTFPDLRPSYSGTTIHSVANRDVQDRIQSTTNTRMKNFLQSNKELAWTIVRWDTLTRPVADRRDFRRDEDLGAIEAVLIDVIAPNLNKARGGWIHDLDPPTSIAEPLARMFALLPNARDSDPVPEEIPQDLREMVDLEETLMGELATLPNFGGVFGGPVTVHVKGEFVDRIRFLNGNATCVHILDFIPEEVGDGKIEPSLTSAVAGRAMTLYKKILGLLYMIETGEDPDHDDIRGQDGPVIDLWRFPRKHKWWGLSALLLGLYIRRIRPYALHSWSSELAYLLQHPTLAMLPLALHDTLDPSLQGPQAMAEIGITIVENTHITQAMNAPVDPQLRQKAGTLQRVIYGPGDQDFANALVKGYAGSMYYRQTHAKYDRRRFVLVHALSVALNRLTEDRAATTKPPQNQEERIALLDAVASDFQKVKVASGVAQALEIEVHRQLIFDKAQGALIGKVVEEADDGEMEERPKKRRKVDPLHPRNNGLLARGGPKSTARREQLQELQDYDSLTEKLGMPSSIGHIANGQRFAEFNSARFAEKRHQRAEAMGRWIQAEQVQELVVVVKALDRDLTYQAFEDSPFRECAIGSLPTSH